MSKKLIMQWTEDIDAEVKYRLENWAEWYYIKPLTDKQDNEYQD